MRFRRGTGETADWYGGGKKKIKKIKKSKIQKNSKIQKKKSKIFSNLKL